ncbi:hypothetical protein ACFPRL_16590 [Pseudoclavibacter helvolus]
MRSTPWKPSRSSSPQAPPTPLSWTICGKPPSVATSTPSQAYPWARATRSSTRSLQSCSPSGAGLWRVPRSASSMSSRSHTTARPAPSGTCSSALASRIASSPQTASRVPRSSLPPQLTPRSPSCCRSRGPMTADSFQRQRRGASTSSCRPSSTPFPRGRSMTFSSSVPAPLAWPRPSTLPPRGSAPPCWNGMRSAGRQGRAP